MAGRDAQSVYIGALVVHAEAVGTEGVNLPAHRSCDIVRHTLLYTCVLKKEEKCCFT